MKLILKNLLALLLFLAITTNIICILPEDKKEIKTVFLTGAAGFIGSNFLKYMFDNYPNYRFLVLDALTYAGNLENIPDYIKNSDRFEFFYGSVSNPYIVDLIMNRSDFVVHFAAESHVTNSIYEDFTFFETDVNGTRVLMRSLVKHKNKVQRFIHISTSEVYGTAESHPMTEDHPLNPRSPYAAAKVGADRIVYSYYCTYDVPVLIIRPFNNYGPRQHIEKVIPRFLSRAISGQTLTVQGSGKQTRDWLYVEDTCKALDKALHVKDFSKLKGQVINIGNGKDHSINYIAQLILKHLNLDEELVEFIKDRPGQVDCHIACIQKAKELLDWEPIVSLEEGLKYTVEWYKSNINWWKKSVPTADFMFKTACLN